MPADHDEIYSQWRDAGPLLEKWHERARINQLQHYEAAKYYARSHNAIGIPVVVLSSVVGTAVFATLQKQVDIRIQIAVGALSVLAAVLAALQTFLRFGERAEKHRSTAATYGSVRHRLEAATNIPLSLRPPLKELLDSIEGQIDSLAQSAPNVPDKVWRRVKRLKSEKHFKPTLPAEDRPFAAAAAAAPSIGDGQPSASAREPYRP